MPLINLKEESMLLNTDEIVGIWVDGKTVNVTLKTSKYYLQKTTYSELIYKIDQALRSTTKGIK